MSKNSDGMIQAILMKQRAKAEAAATLQRLRTEATAKEAEVIRKMKIRTTPDSN